MSILKIKELEAQLVRRDEYILKLEKGFYLIKEIEGFLSFMISIGVDMPIDDMISFKDDVVKLLETSECEFPSMGQILLLKEEELKNKEQIMITAWNKQNESQFITGDKCFCGSDQKYRRNGECVGCDKEVKQAAEVNMVAVDRRRDLEYARDLRLDLF